MPDSEFLADKGEEQEKKDRLIVNRIEDSFVLSPVFPSVSQRYYEKYYYLDPDRERSRDQVLLLHSNRLVLVTLAEKHPLFTLLKDSPFSVDFRVTPKCDRSSNAVRGKGKKGAQGLNPEANLCLIKPHSKEDEEEESIIPVKALIKGKLLEVNTGLITDPEALRSAPSGHGYVALILLPNLPEGLHALKNNFLSQEEYYQRLST